MKRLNAWLRDSLTAEGFWRRAIALCLHVMAGRLVFLLLYVVVVLVYLAVLA